MDFEDEGAEEPDAEAWESEDDEGVEDGMEAQDDSEVTFSLHSGECWAPAEAAGTPVGTWCHLGFPQSPGVHRALLGCCPSAFLGQPSGLSCPGFVSALYSGRRALWASHHGRWP